MIKKLFIRFIRFMIKKLVYISIIRQITSDFYSFSPRLLIFVPFLIFKEELSSNSLEVAGEENISRFLCRNSS